METVQLDKMMEEIAKLKQAQALLEKIWLEVGPYGEELSDEVNSSLREHFGFDDSE